MGVGTAIMQATSNRNAWSMRATPNAVLSLLSFLVVSSCGSGSTPVEQIPPQATTPPPSAGHALVYHNGLGAVVLVNSGLGGMSSPPSTARTKLWKWSGSTWEVIDSSGPPVRNLGGVAYDSHRNVLVMFGGSYSQNLVYDDTWEWSPSSGWAQRNVVGPGKRDHVKMVYDATRRRVVLHGGQAVPPSYPAETWTWNGTTWERQTNTAGPGGRIHFGLTYDATGQRVLLFGGVVPGTGTLGDTWAWTGSWTPAATAKSPRSHAELGMSASGVLLVGGFDDGGSSVVMQLNGQAWTAAGAGPGARYLSSIAFDPNRNVAVLYGGGNPDNDQLLADTWEFSAGTGWRKVK